MMRQVHSSLFSSPPLLFLFLIPLWVLRCAIHPARAPLLFLFLWKNKPHRRSPSLPVHFSSPLFLPFLFPFSRYVKQRTETDRVRCSFSSPLLSLFFLCEVGLVGMNNAKNHHIFILLSLFFISPPLPAKTTISLLSAFFFFFSFLDLSDEERESFLLFLSSSFFFLWRSPPTNFSSPFPPFFFSFPPFFFSMKKSTKSGGMIVDPSPFFLS